MKTEKTLLGTLVSISLMLFGPVAAQAGEDLPDAYVMTVYSDAAHGAEIIDGAQRNVIAKLSQKTGGRSTRLEEQINLCVAYTTTKQLEEASQVCDSAIAAALEEARRLNRSKVFGRRTTQVANTGRAIALTNRGVLHAISGEKDKARLMFEMALLLNSIEESARSNLLLLDRGRRAKDS